MDTLQTPYFFDLSAYQHAALFEDCRYVWEALARLKSYLNSYGRGHIQGKVSERAFLVNPESIVIGEGTVVQEGAYIEGPCILGKNCQVRHGAYIRGDLVAGDHCVIGHASEIKHAIMLNHAAAAHFAYVGDSIIGNKANLGAGTKCANLRFDKRNVKLEGIDTGLRKLGAIIGDGVQVGCNVVFNPGTMVGKCCFICPSLNIGGFLPANSSVSSKSSLDVRPIRLS